ncbi:MAG: hypothetical protein HC812_20045 [Leptolyngbya sp. RL_3_1]|nr:hypothetical protein [Leptolyngbya sp. RL_3_1]
MRHEQHVIHPEAAARIDLGLELGRLCAQLGLTKKEMVKEAKSLGYTKLQICTWNIGYKSFALEAA